MLDAYELHELVWDACDERFGDMLVASPADAGGHGISLAVRDGGAAAANAAAALANTAAGNADQAVADLRAAAQADDFDLPNEVGGRATTLPEDVEKDVRALLKAYDAHAHHTLEDVISFHVRFERIHPLQDGNGRVGRLIMFKECLANGVVPFIISDDMKAFYYRGLAEWDNEKDYLTDTCLAAQDRFKAVLDYFRITH